MRVFKRVTEAVSKGFQGVKMCFVWFQMVPGGYKVVSRGFGSDFL